VKLSRQIVEHHKAQFGNVPFPLLMLKLTEEVGEVASDIYRHEATFDEHHLDRAVNEIGDVLTVLTVLASYCGADIETIYKRAAERFTAREFEPLSIDSPP
jgi:NTP pyrophosphatase (non-canonical NTP hydrolase)